MKEVLHSVLGTEYKVKIGEDVKLHEDYAGECKIFTKEILVSSKYDGFSEEELKVKVQEVVAHEFLHAYLNEAGLLLNEDVEESIADFFMKNWRKINNSILEVLDQTDYLE